MLVCWCWSPEQVERGWAQRGEPGWYKHLQHMAQTEKSSRCLVYQYQPNVLHCQSLSAFSEAFSAFLYRVSRAPTDLREHLERMGRGWVYLWIRQSFEFITNSCKQEADVVSARDMARETEHRCRSLCPGDAAVRGKESNEMGRKLKRRVYFSRSGQKTQVLLKTKQNNLKKTIHPLGEQTITSDFQGPINCSRTWGTEVPDKPGNERLNCLLLLPHCLVNSRRPLAKLRLAMTGLEWLV